VAIRIAEEGTNFPHRATGQLASMKSDKTMAADALA
jgi:hypothetical protein